MVVGFPLMAKCTRCNIVWLSLSVTCCRSMVFSGSRISSKNKTDRHDITEILLKVGLNNITLTLYVMWSGYTIFTFDVQIVSSISVVFLSSNTYSDKAYCIYSYLFGHFSKNVFCFVTCDINRYFGQFDTLLRNRTFFLTFPCKVIASKTLLSKSLRNPKRDGQQIWGVTIVWEFTTELHHVFWPKTMVLDQSVDSSSLTFDTLC
jgi:hypothetical protein